MRRRGTQTERVLAWARSRPDRPLRQLEWMQTPAPDGGPPITRLAAIIGFLEDEGHCFHHRPIDGGRVEYVLRHDVGDKPTWTVDRSTDGSPAAQAEPEQLIVFDPPTEQPPVGRPTRPDGRPAYADWDDE